MTRPVVVFAGDSVTDCGRREDPLGLGDGYVRLLADDHPGFDVVNRGVSGDRVRDLRARWKSDVLDLRPTLVSIMVGINDTWRRYDSDDATDVAAFERDYRSLIAPLAAARAALVLVEPVLLPVRRAQTAWREDLDPKIAVVRSLAIEFGATLVLADQVLNALGEPAELAPDGVHPSRTGHRRLADLWSREAAPLLARLG